jgi:hypothetical protein
MLIVYSLWHCTQLRKCCRGILGLFGVPDSFCSVGEMHTRYVAEVTGNVEADFRFVQSLNKNGSCCYQSLGLDSIFCEDLITSSFAGASFRLPTI